VGLRNQGLQVLMARGLLSGGFIRMEVPWSDSNRILLSKECVRFPVDLARQKIGRELERFLVV
jgi:tRNA wybutosine-synthesizing protein 3